MTECEVWVAFFFCTRPRREERGVHAAQNNNQHVATIQEVAYLASFALQNLLARHRNSKRAQRRKRRIRQEYNLRCRGFAFRVTCSITCIMPSGQGYFSLFTAEFVTNLPHSFACRYRAVGGLSTKFVKESQQAVLPWQQCVICSSELTSLCR